MNVDIAGSPQGAQTITRAQAEGFYNGFLEKVRNRHGKWLDDPTQPWDMAVAHVVMGTSDWEALVILRYLVGQKALAVVDALIVESIARRLHLVIEWKRTELAGA